MENLHKRNITKTKIEKDNKNDKKVNNSKKSDNNSSLLKIIKAISKILFNFTLLFFASSYLITSTFTWGQKIPNWRRYIPRKELVFTEEELAQYDGTDPKKPIYLSCMGNVYDVTYGAHFYAPGAGYHLFAGRDSSRALATGCLQDKSHWTHDLRGLDEYQLSIIKSWDRFWKNNSQYFYVGKLITSPIDPNTEPPEDCGATKEAKEKMKMNKDNYEKDPSLKNLIGSFI